ncbi:luciferase-like monooxygenase [Mycobacteroides abscessus subsp. massiliense]|nr:luciferase-like monooxygenase [Mycobacteroides abscessus subsp. massiliense]
MSLDGTYYQVDDAIVAPTPLQPNGIPLWIAGGGEKVTLRIAARYAQYTNFGQTAEEFGHKSRVLAAHCKDIGTDFDAIVRSANMNIVIGSDAAEVADRLAAIKARLVPILGEDVAEGTVANLATTAGTPEQIAERLAEYRGLGLGYAICNFPEAAYDRAGIDLFVREVVGV